MYFFKGFTYILPNFPPGKLCQLFYLKLYKSHTLKKIVILIFFLQFLVHLTSYKLAASNEFLKLIYKIAYVKNTTLLS